MKTCSRMAGTIALISIAIWLIALSPLRYVDGIRHVFALFDPAYVPSKDEEIPFDHDLWMTRNASYRTGMANSLVKESLLEGMTRGQLIEMLGPPDIEQPGDEGTRWLLGYILKGLFDESLWLELTIKPDGTATGAGFGTHWIDLRKK